MRMLILILLIFTSCKSISPPSEISSALVTPNPSREAQALIKFLREQYGKKVISGVMTLNSFDEFDRVKKISGKAPAILGMDFMHHNRGYTQWFNEDQILLDAEKHKEQNGITTFMWHWRDPSRKTESFYTSETNFDLSLLQNPLSEEYQSIIKDIDYIASFLKKIPHIPILWRPLHEASGTWFWWGAKGPHAYKVLYRLMFERLVHHHQINNLIWVWTAEKNDILWYPGDDVVDIIGTDIYNGSMDEAFISLQSRYPDKIISLSECGTLPDLNKSKWSWFMCWYGDFVLNNSALWTSILHHPEVITLDKMPKL
jgi:mannan endo-1,4-beta-mannosidase